MSRNAIRFAIIFSLVLAALWLFMNYLLPIGLPFLLGALLALSAEPATAFFQRRLSLPRGGAVALSVSSVFLLTVTVISLLLALLVRQLQNLAGLLPKLEHSLDQSVSMLRLWLEQLATKLPGSFGIIAQEWAEDLLGSGSAMMEQLLLQIPKLATGLVGGVSKGMLGLVTGIISAYMIACRLPLLQTWWQRHQPASWQQKWQPALSTLKKALGGWFWAEVKLAGLAFAVMALGFLLLRIENSLVWAGLITLVDAFPVLGVGTILVPWAIFTLLQGDGLLGFGLLGIYGVIWLTRSVLEPRLVGKGIGLDPLVALIAIYAGWKLWGLAGLLLAPILALAAAQGCKQLQR